MHVICTHDFHPHSNPFIEGLNPPTQKKDSSLCSMVVSDSSFVCSSQTRTWPLKKSDHLLPPFFGTLVVVPHRPATVTTQSWFGGQKIREIHMRVILFLFNSISTKSALTHGDGFRELFSLPRRERGVVPEFAVPISTASGHMHVGETVLSPTAGFPPPLLSVAGEGKPHDVRSRQRRHRDAYSYYWYSIQLTWD